MDFINTPFLGFANTQAEAVGIIHETGNLYLLVACAYLFSFLSRIKDSKHIKDQLRLHAFTITFWFFAAIMLLSDLYPTIISVAVFWFSLNALVCINILKPYMLKSALPRVDFLENKPEGKISSLLEKASTAQFLNCSLINEHILWLIIFIKSVVAFRAALAF